METPNNKPQLFSLVRNFTERIIQFIKGLWQKHLAFLFFVAIAAAAWLLRALGDTYIATIEYPVKYTNLPPHKILSEPPLDKLTLQVQSDGYTILSSRFKYKRPLDFNVNAFALYSLSEDSTSVYTLTRYRRNHLSTELNLTNKNIQILDISPDTIIFNFSKVKRKKIPVKPQLAITPDMFEQQYMLNGIPYAIPDSLQVTGPSFIVDTLTALFTEEFSVRHLSDTAKKRIALKKIKRLNVPEKRVEVIIPVDEFTEKDFEIPIQKRDVPDSLQMKTFPGTASVKILVTLSNYQRVTADLFQIWVKYDTLNPAASPHLKVQIDSLPPYVHNIKMTPRIVEYIIEKRND